MKRRGRRVDDTGLTFHPIANVFPLIEGAEFDELVADIRQYGLREPIVLYEGAVLDGRNRYRASLEAGVECPAVPYDGDDPVGFVVSLNLRRRHLNTSQRAMVAANLATLTQGGDRSKAPIGALTGEQAATMLNVSPRGVDRARAVRDDGVPELQGKVVSGALSVSTAADIARLPEGEQRQVVQLSDREILDRAKAIRAEQAQERRAIALGVADAAKVDRASTKDQRSKVRRVIDPEYRDADFQDEAEASARDLEIERDERIALSGAGELAKENDLLRAQIAALDRRINAQMQENSRLKYREKMWRDRAIDAGWRGRDDA